MRHSSKFFIFKNKYIEQYLNKVARVVTVFFFFLCLAAISAFIYRFGVGLSDMQEELVNSFFRDIRAAFLVLLILKITLESLLHHSVLKLSAKIIYSFALLMLFPLWFSRPEDAVFGTLWDIVDNSHYGFIVMFVVSTIEVSKSVVRMLGRRTSPSFILISSFLVIILIGAGLLLLPNASVSGISVIDALFVSTSAVCVTGLTPVDVSQAFTPMGQLIIIILIQIGGLGIMTFTSFFALFLTGGSSLYNQIILSDMISSGSLNSLFGTLKRVLGFTLIIEALGVLFIWISIHGTLDMTLQDEFAFSAFHAISAFCNAGFSTLPQGLGNVDVILNNAFLVIISLLIVFGGIGFPILSNFMTIAALYLRRGIRFLFHKQRRFSKWQHLYSINTKIALLMTLCLIVGGTLMLAINEWNGAFEGMSFSGKLTQSFFNAVSPRTAGFVSANITTFSASSILIIIVLMWIGGGAQSTAGGVKINAFAVSLLSMVSVLKGKSKVEVFGRTVSAESVFRSNATLLLSLFFIFIAFYSIILLEPTLPIKNILFEVVSAIGTVGLSLDTTPLLGTGSKLILILLMFIGRIGVLVFVMAFLRRSSSHKYKYPEERVIIN